MKKFIKTALSLLLVIALSVTAMLPASAAGRRVSYLSELQMAEGKDEAAAKKILEDKGFTVIDKNLNPGTDKAVYLGYKTSTDVEDAITDVAVMNMKGGYNITDYETIIADSLSEYLALIDRYRDAANEFAANYKAGDHKAALAYRQMNYYYFQDGDNKIKMGDYFLNFPEKDEDFANILMKGNVNILANLRSLLAMSTGVPGESLFDRVAEATKDEAVYGKIEYYESGKLIYNTISGVENDLEKAVAEIKEIEADETLTQEDKDSIINGIQVTNSNLLAFKALFDSMKYKDTTYGEYYKTMNHADVDYSVFYPIVEAMTKGQRAMMDFGQLPGIFVYDTIEKSNEELEAELQEIEKDSIELDVFLGTDMSIFENSLAVTTDALRKEAETGEAWDQELASRDVVADLVISSVIGLGGGALFAVALDYLKTHIDIANSSLSNYNYLQSAAESISKTLDTLKKNIAEISSSVPSNSNNIPESTMNYLTTRQNMVTEKMIEYNQVTSDLSGYQVYHVSAGTIALSAVGMAMGIATLTASIFAVVNIVNSYKIEYTDIPANMVDCVETENGDRYIRYSVVNSFYEEDGEIKERAGDTNGYDGRQWNALYYTKNYEAGKCMTAVADIPEGETDFGTYTPVHKFGINICYDLNLYNDDNNDKIYLAFGNSNNKKAAETEVPDVVGSAFAYGMIGISGVAGLAVGMCIMNVLKKKSKTKA